MSHPHAHNIGNTEDYEQQFVWTAEEIDQLSYVLDMFYEGDE